MHRGNFDTLKVIHIHVIIFISCRQMQNNLLVLLIELNILPLLIKLITYISSYINPLIETTNN